MSKDDSLFFLRGGLCPYCGLPAGINGDAGKEKRMKKIIDAKGLPCPQPVIKAKAVLKEMTEGTVEVLVDNEIAVQNLMKLGGYFGLKPVSEKVSEEEFRVSYDVTERNGEMLPGDGRQPADAEAVTEAEACIPDARRKGQVVVISSDCMGTGDDELGRQLMKGFLYAQTQLDVLPDTILLYNGGAKLSAEGSQSVEDLRSLEAQGVEILTCGTCLNYYGLSGKLAVGNVTNMYDIAEKLSGAASIIRP